MNSKEKCFFLQGMIPASSTSNILLANMVRLSLEIAQKRGIHVLGIESSCDDAAISIVNYEKRRVLSDLRSSDFAVHSRARGIIPYTAAIHHREAIPRLIKSALTESHLRASDIDAIAVSTRPGLVISLKVGIENALSFARDFRRPLLPVHHMRAHALVLRLLDPNLHFPFPTLLISGAHCLICLVSSPFHFQILAEAKGGSPGECLDKLAREMDIEPVNGHYGAALEKMAKNSSPDAHINYAISFPKFATTWLDFDQIKERYLKKIHHWKRNKMDRGEMANLCAGIQHSLIEYTCHHLELVLAFLAQNVSQFVSDHSMRKLVVAGGVAANARFFERIYEVASIHKFTPTVPPSHLCTDNGVMVAWTGAEIFDQIKNGKGEMVEGEPNIYWPSELPDSIYALYKAEIGPRMEWSPVGGPSC